MEIEAYTAILAFIVLVELVLTTHFAGKAKELEKKLVALTAEVASHRQEFLRAQHEARLAQATLNQLQSSDARREARQMLDRAGALGDALTDRLADRIMTWNSYPGSVQEGPHKYLESLKASFPECFKQPA